MADAKSDIKPDISDEKVQVQVNFGERSFRFAIKPTTQLRKVFDSTEKQVAAQPGTLKFFMNGTRVNTQDTLKTLEVDLTDEIIIDANLEQVGGGNDKLWRPGEDQK